MNPNNQPHLHECCKILAKLNPLKNNFPTDSPARSIQLPIPSLALDFRLCCKLNPKTSVGIGPWGHRNWISFEGGEWYASWGSGTIVPGGQDSQLVTPDLAVRVETNYLLKTNDETPAHICVKTTGWRTGPDEVMQKLFDPRLADEVSAEEYSFRLFVNFETGDDRYAFLNTGMWVGSAARRGAEGEFDQYSCYPREEQF